MSHDVLHNEETGEPITVELYGINGEPISIKKWVEIFRKSAGRTTEIGRHIIMTRWTGVDTPDPARDLRLFYYTRWEPNETPLIYWTAVLNLDFNVVESAQYATKQAALEGHQAFVDKYKETE